MTPTRDALVKLAHAAQILDEAGLYKDADLVDEFVKQAMAEPDMEKVAGMWANFVSRLGGWARQLLFREYRDLYRRAKAAQDELQRETQAYLEQAKGWVQDAKGLKKTLKRHNMQEWRQQTGELLNAMRVDPAGVLGPYDEQYGQMIARVLKIAPQKLPQRQPPRPGGEPSSEAPEAPETPETPAEPSPAAPAAEAVPAPSAPEQPETVAPEAVAPETAPEAPGETPEAVPEAPGTAPETIPGSPEAPSEAPETPAEPAEGWRVERFGRSRKHGWEWQWEVSDDNNRIRLPKAQLLAAAAGQGKILHNRDDMYRPTYGTASLKLKTLMGDTWWRAEDDPNDPNMSILTRTEDEIEPPHRIGRQPPTEQAERLRGLREESSERFSRLTAIAKMSLAGKTDEERLADAAAELFGRLEAEEEQQ
jgi:hypothetical protein